MLIVKSMLILVDDIFIVWSKWISSLSSSRMCFDMVMISDPESRTPTMEHPTLSNLPSMAQSGRLWWVTMSPSSFWRTQSLYSWLTEKGSWPASSLTRTRWADRFITCLTVVRSQNCFQNSSKTANRFFTGTRTLESSILLSTHASTDLSSRSQEYLHCDVGTKKEVG